MTGFCGFVLTSATGAKSRLTPTAASSAPIDAATRSVSSTSSTTPSAPLPGYELPGRRFEPRDVAPLLVDRDDDVGSLRVEVARELRELLAALDVPGVQHHPAEAFGEATAHPVRHGRPLEAREDAGRGEPLELVRHAFTAPAVRPDRIFRCSARKKNTTGIAVSVDAAMSAPQSVALLVP